MAPLVSSASSLLEVREDGIFANGERVQTKAPRELHADDKGIIIAAGSAAFCAGLFGIGEGWSPLLYCAFLAGGVGIMAPISPFVRSHVRWLSSRPALWALVIAIWLLLAVNVALYVLHPSVGGIQQQAASLPTSPNGLAPGTVWNNGGVLSVTPAESCFGGPCPTYSGAPLAWAWEQYNVSFQLPSAPTAPALILSFGVLGENVGNDDVTLKDAYMVSGIDGTKMPLKVRVEPDAWIDVSEASPVPPGAQFTLAAQIGGSTGIPESDFLRTWGPLTVVIDYGDQTVRHNFSRQLIQSQIDSQNPYTRPHVTQRAK